jgi:hypothetical protein
VRGAPRRPPQPGRRGHSLPNFRNSPARVSGTYSPGGQYLGDHSNSTIDRLQFDKVIDKIFGERVPCERRSDLERVGRAVARPRPGRSRSRTSAGRRRPGAASPPSRRTRSSPGGPRPRSRGGRPDPSSVTPSTAIWALPGSSCPSPTRPIAAAVNWSPGRTKGGEGRLHDDRQAHRQLARAEAQPLGAAHAKPPASSWSCPASFRRSNMSIAVRQERDALPWPVAERARQSVSSGACRRPLYPWQCRHHSSGWKRRSSGRRRHTSLP